MKKYMKPLARGLDDVSIAIGALCTSGGRPNQACTDGGANVGPCEYGTTAGRNCTLGTTAGTPTTCTPGDYVTDCSFGSHASVKMPGGG